MRTRHSAIFSIYNLRIVERHNVRHVDLSDMHVKFSKKKCRTACDNKLSTSNFHVCAARSRHLHNEFKDSFQGDGMDNSNKHC